MEKGRLVILSGPSGVGKDTVIEAWSAQNPRVQRVVAYTTRMPRPREREGIDYRFVDLAEFKRKADAGEFLEHKEVHGRHYATPLCETEALLSEGKVAILKIDVQGALEVMPRRPDAISIFLLPPSRTELDRRLSERGTERPEDRERRLVVAQEEMALAPAYRFQVVNDDLERVVSELERIVSEA